MDFDPDNGTYTLHLILLLMQKKLQVPLERKKLSLNHLLLPLTRLQMIYGYCLPQINCWLLQTIMAIQKKYIL